MIDPSNIIKELEQLDEKLLEAIKKILGANPTKEQLLQFLASEEFDKIINDLGFEKSISKYVKGFDLSFSQSISNFGAMDFQAEQIKLISQNVELIKASYGRTVLGYAKANSELLRSKLIQSVINGITARQTIKELGGQLISTLTNAPLTTAQIGAVINTSYADFSRATTGLIYQDKPEQRFKYIGGVIPTSSDECRWLMNNQNPEGYTRAEIDAGIETPFAYTSGEMIGQVKKIYWTGRLPNFNCIHEWLPID